MKFFILLLTIVSLSYSTTTVYSINDGDYNEFNKILGDLVIDGSIDGKVNFVTVGDMNSLKDSVKSNDNSIAISSISVTSDRNKEFNFSYPYETSKMGILLNTNTTSFSDIFMSFVKKLSHIVWYYLGFCVISAIVFMLIDRKNEHFKGNMGFLNAFYYVNTVCVTVGFGDITPKNGISKVLTTIIFYVGIAFSGLVIGAGVTAFDQSSVENVKSVDDLNGERIGVVRGTVSEKFIQSAHVKPIIYTTLDDAKNAFVNGGIDGLLYDEFMLNSIKTSNTNFIETKLPTQYYAIMANKNFDMVKVNNELLKSVETSTYDMIKDSKL